MAQRKFLISLWLIALLFTHKVASARSIEKKYSSSTDAAALVPNNANYIIGANVAPPPDEESYYFTPIYSRKLRVGFRLLEGGRGGSRTNGIKLIELSPSPSPSAEPYESHEEMLTMMIRFVSIVFFTAVFGVIMGYLIGSTFHNLQSTEIQIPRPNYIAEDNKHTKTFDSVSAPLPSISASSPQASISPSYPHVSNPRGAESLPPGIVEPSSDFYLHRLQGNFSEDLVVKQKYLLALAVGYDQKDIINEMIMKFSENFSIVLFHYDGKTSGWDQFEWSHRAIHISARKQAKWWYAKRFLHPDIVSAYEYIFIWDEDLGVEHFNAEEYLKLVKKHDLEISQPGVESDSKRKVKEDPGKCHDENQPPCAGFVEIMAPVFSKKAWQCVWHMIQNDLIHGWGIDLALWRCVERPHEMIGVVDAQWVEHKLLPSLGDQVRARCYAEWKEFERRMYKASIEMGSTRERTLL
ncbi:hypothetical protein Vadar_017449 [Vaccinium darrowii]|uniref:Uncharacterized protein n=1 Tax=Vaccinium darrowii TaxID=229202 RepID=A0ACB7ZKX5_9ERIC|nr:hypothetical protein Vadar_017449 [Vaccinium darrowii]